MKYLVIPVTLLLLCTGCKNKPVNRNDTPVARVFNSYLYHADLRDIIPSGISGNDSATMAKDYIEKWVRNQLMLSKAELNLTDEEKDVEQQIENYRSSLLIYAYEQSYIRQKMDTIVTDREIDDFYKQNQSNFILNRTLMRGLFIKVPSGAPELYKLRRWYRSEVAADIRDLEGYCFKHATLYDHFNDGWVNLSEVLRLLPASLSTAESALQSRNYLETWDAGFVYFVNAKEIHAAGTVTPLELVKNDIRSIILNKRKITLVNELESDIFLDAQNREHFNIYQ